MSNVGLTTTSQFLLYKDILLRWVSRSIDTMPLDQLNATV
jgi:hypothetical protein